jgi:hypothetical protein
VKSWKEKLQDATRHNSEVDSMFEYFYSYYDTISQKVQSTEVLDQQSPCDVQVDESSVEVVMRELCMSREQPIVFLSDDAN